MREKLENLCKHYTIYNTFMKTNIEEVITDVVLNSDEINPIIINVNIELVMGVINCIITNLELDYTDNKLHILVYEVLLELYIHNKLELGNLNDFTSAGVTIDIDIQSNKLISEYTRNSVVLIDYSNEYINSLIHFYNIHDELIHSIDIPDDSTIVYIGMTSSYIANILII